MRFKEKSAAQYSVEGEVGVSQGRISMRAVAPTLLQPVSNYFLNNSQLFPRLYLNNFFQNQYVRRGSRVLGTGIRNSPYRIFLFFCWWYWKNLVREKRLGTGIGKILYWKKSQN